MLNNRFNPNAQQQSTSLADDPQFQQLFSIVTLIGSSVTALTGSVSTLSQQLDAVEEKVTTLEETVEENKDNDGSDIPALKDLGEYVTRELTGIKATQETAKDAIETLTDGVGKILGPASSAADLTAVASAITSGAGASISSISAALQGVTSLGGAFGSIGAIVGGLAATLGAATIIGSTAQPTTVSNTSEVTQLTTQVNNIQTQVQTLIEGQASGGTTSSAFITETNRRLTLIEDQITYDQTRWASYDERITQAYNIGIDGMNTYATALSVTNLTGLLDTTIANLSDSGIEIAQIKALNTTQSNQIGVLEEQVIGLLAAAPPPIDDGTANQAILDRLTALETTNTAQGISIDSANAGVTNIANLLAATSASLTAYQDELTTYKSNISNEMALLRAQDAVLQQAITLNNSNLTNTITYNFSQTDAAVNAVTVKADAALLRVTNLETLVDTNRNEALTKFSAIYNLQVPNTTLQLLVDRVAALEVSDTQADRDRITSLEASVTAIGTDLTTTSTYLTTQVSRIDTLSTTSATQSTALTAVQILAALADGIDVVVQVGDIGGNNTAVGFSCSRTGFIVSCVKTSNSNASVISLGWADQGYDIFPVLTFLNRNDDSSYLNNSLVNDVGVPMVIQHSVSRTGLSIYLEETVGAAQQFRILLKVLRRKDMIV